jgi:hypothetical protein
MHTTRYKTHGFNFHVGSSSVDATGSAVEAECSISVTSLWQQGWGTQSGDSKGLSIIGPDGGSVINFDIVVRTTGDAVYVGHFVRGLEHAEGAEILGANPSIWTRKMTILAAHQMLGHKSEDSTWQTAKALGIIITYYERQYACVQSLHSIYGQAEERP